jgi:hypothetical protein
MTNTNTLPKHQLHGEAVQNPDAIENMHAVMERVLPIFELEGEDFDNAVHEFVAARTVELESHGTESSIGHHDGGTDKFIGPDTAMVGSMLMSKPYYMDDPSAYEIPFKNMKQYYDLYKTKLPTDRAYLNAAVNGVNLGQAQYFESIVGDPGAHRMVMADIIDFDDLDVSTPDNGSIADFKKVAMCQERTAVAHNTLKILGVDSRYETGYVSVMNEDGSEQGEPHGFVTFLNTQGGRVLFDPTNPVLVRNERSEITTISPFHFKIGDMADNKAHGVLVERTVTDGELVVTRSRELTYTFKALER